MAQQTSAPNTRLASDETCVRITTEDPELLLPALAQWGASFRLTGRRLDVRGVALGDLALLAAMYNARVSDLETVDPSSDGSRSRNALLKPSVPA